MIANIATTFDQLRKFDTFADGGKQWTVTNVDVQADVVLTAVQVGSHGANVVTFVRDLGAPAWRTAR